MTKLIVGVLFAAVGSAACADNSNDRLEAEVTGACMMGTQSIVESDDKREMCECIGEYVPRLLSASGIDKAVRYLEAANFDQKSAVLRGMTENDKSEFSRIMNICQ